MSALALTLTGPGIDRTSAVVVIVVSSAVALVVAFVGRTTLVSWAATTLLLLAGAGIGLGAAAFERGGLGQDRPLGPQALAAIVILAVLTPLHVRVVLGPLGRKA